MTNQQRFLNKVVIITGGASGIGRATAQQFAKEGAQVILTDIQPKMGKQVAHQLQQEGYRCQFIKVDVTSASDVQNVVTQIKNQHKKIDVLFNNAGIEISGPLINFTEKDFDRLINVNLKGVFLFSKYVLQHMVRRKQGVIVNMASVAAFLAWPNDAIYSASKAGVKLLTQAMAVEYAPYSIRVNAIAPGIIDTPMTDRAIGTQRNKTQLKKKKGQLHPLGRLGTPEEVAQVVLFLASKEAAFITGATFSVDGGYLAG